MKVFTRAASALCLLNLGCSLQPSQQLPPVASLTASAHAVSLTVHIVPAKQLLGVGGVHYWTAADINLYRVQLQVLQGGSYVNVAGATTDLPQQPGSTQLTSASFNNLAGNNDYHVTVQAYGDVGGATHNTLLDLVTPTIVDFDFRTPTQNLPTTLANSGMVTLDNTTFAGALTVTSTGTPGGTVSMLAQLWSGSTLVTSQSFGATANSFVFNNLVAGTTYFVKLMAEDGSSNVLATATSANQTFTGQDVSPTASLAVVLAAVVPPVTLSMFTVGGSPEGVAVDPGNGHVWVADHSSGNMTELTSTGSVLGTFLVDRQAYGVAIGLADSVWVTTDAEGTVAELSSTGSVLRAVGTGFNPLGVAVDALGNVWVANSQATPFSVTELSSAGSHLGTFTVGTAPVGVAADSNGHIWVTNSGSNTVMQLSSAGNVSSTTTVGAAPKGVAIDFSSHDVWVTNSGSTTVTEVSSSGGVMTTVTVGSGPNGVAVDPRNHNVWVTNGGSTTVTELSSAGVVLGTFTLGSAPQGIAIDGNGHVWVTASGGNLFELPD